MFRMTLLLVVCALLAVVRGANTYPPAKPTYPASASTTWDKVEVEGSRSAVIDVQFLDAAGNADYITMKRLDLVGDAHARGYAHGALLAHQIVSFTGPEMDKFYASAVLNLDLSQFPEPLQKLLRVVQVGGAALAPRAFKAAQQWVWESEKSYVPDVLIQEMDGMAEGICYTLGHGCDVEAWKDTIHQMNMLPELIRMACTAFGAWGKATPNGGLIQLRALDFGSGPWANNTVVAVHRGDPANPSNAFVSVCFPAFVGAITGMSQSGVAISEKVWMTYDTPDLQPGNYKGLADVFVLRELLEFATSRQDAEKYIMQTQRTWAMWVGVGGYSDGMFDLVGYKEDSAVVYNDETIGTMTGMPYLESVVYVDKHPQPSNDGPNGTLPTALTDFYGRIDLETSKQIVEYHQTGDVHAALYDFSGKSFILAIGKTDRSGNYGESCAGCAYNRPWLSFNLDELWKGL